MEIFVNLSLNVKPSVKDLSEQTPLLPATTTYYLFEAKITALRLVQKWSNFSRKYGFVV